MSDINVIVNDEIVNIDVIDEPVLVNVINSPGVPGAPGVGVPVGGTTGQVLAKNSNTNYDTEWVDVSGGAWGTITGTLSNQTDLQSALNAKVPYTGATTNVNLGEYEIKAGQLTLDTSPTGTAAVGTTRWNDTIGSSETTLKGGSVILKNGVDLVARVVNKVSPNTTLTKAAYQAVRVSGAQGQRLAVALAQANNDANSADTIGLVTETIATNQEGFIMTVGQLENINTTGSLQGETWVDGDVLYLSPFTPGAITKVKPTGNGHIVVIGYVEYAHANNGKIYLKVMNGWELDELHDVSITSVANNEALIYESATALWKNKSIATALGYTPANAATTLTINGVTFDLSTSRTWTVSGGISGSGASGQVAYWDGTTSQAGSANFLWDNTNSNLAIGAATTWQAGIGKLSVVNGATDAPILSLKNTDATKQVYYASYNDSNKSLQYIVYGSTAPGTLLGQFRANAAVILGYNTPSVLAIGNFENVPLVLGTNNAERLRIFGGGNVGINTGTTDGGQRLQVQGTTLLNGNVTFSSATGMTWDATNSRLGIGTNAPICGIDARNRLRVSGTLGVVGAIGGNNYPLSVQDNGDASWIEILNNGGAGKGVFFGLSNVNTANTFELWNYQGGAIDFYNGTAASTGTRKLRIWNNGNVTIQNGGTFTDSGERIQVTGTMKVTGASSFGGNMTLSLNQNSATGINVNNTTSGAASESYINFQSDSSSGTAGISKFSTTKNAYKIISAKDFNFYNPVTGGDIAILNDFATGNIKFAAGGSSTAHMTIKSNGRINMSSLPTSSTGLATGDLWNDAGTIKIV
jgi:nitrogen fixation protein